MKNYNHSNRHPSVLTIITATVLITVISFGVVLANSPPPPGPNGLDIVRDEAKDAGTLYPGSVAVTQSIFIEDNDDNSDEVVVTEVIIDNLGDASAGDISKIGVYAKTEVMDEFALKGEANVEGFPLTIDIENFSVADDGSAYLHIKVHVSNSIATEGTLQLETPLVHNEGASYGIRKTVVDKAPEMIKKMDKLSIPYVVSHWDTEEGKIDPNDPCEISMDQILNAIRWWADNTEVPHTGGNTIDIETILDLIQLWAKEECWKNQDPEAAISTEPSPPEGSLPLEVSFDASASFDPDGSIVSYEWDFGDPNSGEDNTASGKQVTHTYYEEGTFTVKLTVTDDSGNKNLGTLEVELG